jgi:hypothetical protein
VTGIWFLGEHGRKNPHLALIPSTLKNKKKEEEKEEERGFSKALVPTCKTTRCHKPGGHNLKTHCCRNLNMYGQAI